MEDITTQVKRVWDPVTGLLCGWAERPDRLDLYQTALGWPMVTTTMDGFGAAAPWKQDFGKTKSETLFLALLDISDSWSAFYFKDHDFAYGELSWVEPKINVERVHPRALGLFESDPAEEGGPTYLVYFINTIENSVVFMYEAEKFRISVFGDMKAAVPEALANRAKTATSLTPDPNS